MYKREWTRFGASLRDGAKPLRVQVPPSPVRSGPRSLRSTARGLRARQFLYTREETKWPSHSESRYLNTPRKHGVSPLARGTRTTGVFSAGAEPRPIGAQGLTLHCSRSAGEAISTYEGRDKVDRSEPARRRQSTPSLATSTPRRSTVSARSLEARERRVVSSTGAEPRPTEASELTLHCSRSAGEAISIHMRREHPNRSRADPS